MSDDLDRILALYPKIQDALPDVHQRNRTVFATCPAHDDKTPSLHVSLSADGKLLLHCFAKCPNAKVIKHAGLRWHDCFPQHDQRRNQGRVAAIYDYHEPDGKVRFSVERIEWVDPSGHACKRFRRFRLDENGQKVWNLDGVTPLLYRLPELVASPPGRHVLVVEGEADADMASSLGFIATSKMGGSNAEWLPAYTGLLEGRSVFVVADGDEAGYKSASGILGALALAGTAKSIAGGWLPSHDLSDRVKELRQEAYKRSILASRSWLRDRLIEDLNRFPVWSRS